MMPPNRGGAIIVIVDEQARDRLSNLWDEHCRARFPARLRIEDVGEIECVMVDEHIAGCIHTLLFHGSLDERREAILKWRLDHLAIILPLLADEAESVYYDRLRVMAELALHAGVRGSGHGGD